MVSVLQKNIGEFLMKINRTIWNSNKKAAISNILQVTGGCCEISEGST